jgi:hypothetical protein
MVIWDYGESLAQCSSHISLMLIIRGVEGQDSLCVEASISTLTLTLVLVLPYAVKHPRHVRPKSQSTPLPDKSLDLDGLLKSLLALGNTGLGLVTHNTATPALAGILVLLKVTLLDGRDELGELVLVLGADLGEGEDSSGLVARVVSETALTNRVSTGKTQTFLWTTVPRRALPLMMA